ncbi:MAG TPA: formylglycine-generating enzyme family protein [Chitinophaga sp.]|nr:formylglycine-generating enzyme family protein [Chitinophaga sp.]
MNARVIISMLFLISFTCCSEQTEVVQEIPTPAATPFTDTVSMAMIGKGSYQPLYGKANAPVLVDSFLMDVYPVTNSRYQDFVKHHPEWQRSKVKHIYADNGYLADWTTDTTFNAGKDPQAPVTNVSWFAAKAYCSCLGKQLPTVDQWEYAAMADQHTADARKKESYNAYILSWYGQPRAYTKAVGQTIKNYWGIRDMHGLVWEWTADFNSIMITGESRRDVSNDNNMFCAAGALSATDRMNYAAFMRYAFRGSLKADYTVRNQGFRCVTKIK